jgi:PKD repeat protein
MIPLTVNFIDESLGGSAIESRLWDFGDGNTSTNPNPTHTYAEAGNYTVSLTITRSDGRKDVEPKNAFINAYKRILVNPGILSGVILPSVKNESVFTHSSMFRVVIL